MKEVGSRNCIHRCLTKLVWPYLFGVYIEFAGAVENDVIFVGPKSAGPRLAKPQPSAVRGADRVAVLIKLAMLLLAPLPPAQVAAGAETAPPTAGPIGRLDDLNWKARREAKLLEASSRPVRLALLGDSITANYELKGPEPLRDHSGVWQRYYADRYPLNLGFSGDGTRHLLWRIMHGEIDSIAPRVAVILSKNI